MEKRAKTIFCDIDGTLVKHFIPTITQKTDHRMILLEGTLEKLTEWEKMGYNIILTTGRKESLRKVTEQQLQDVGIIYDQLIMGIGAGVRVLINDKKPDLEETAFCFCPNRDEGISNIKI